MTFHLLTSEPDISSPCPKMHHWLKFDKIHHGMLLRISENNIAENACTHGHVQCIGKENKNITALAMYLVLEDRQGDNTID